MKRIAAYLSIIILAVFPLFANGVAVVDGTNGIYLNCVSSDIAVTVESQVAITKAIQEFVNDLDIGKFIKYAFPLPEQASATQLRWRVADGAWKTAAISTVPQDTTLPGPGPQPGVNQNLADYLGATPLYFEIPDGIKEDSSIVIELTYVELLPYENGIVTYIYPNDYGLIQTSAISQSLVFSLTSGRTISAIDLMSHSATDNANTGSEATISYESSESTADTDYKVQYSLSLDELGLFSLSTFLPDEDMQDNLGNGFFLFVAEPDPSDNTDVIDKVFTLIIDRSGSMAGDKMIQARNAASFIVDNLNEGDKFNIVDFATNVSSFRSEHVEFTPENKTAALNYIGLLSASGSTNISGAFETAIPQFSAAGNNTANIIIFFTDGEATTGITTTEGILDDINSLTLQNESDIMIFTFGIGSSVNDQLLSSIAKQNNGLAEFLGSDELEIRITNFYLKIRYPVLLNTQAMFSPAVITEVYPSPLPNLYKGQQMIFVGRYETATPVDATFSGEAFGQPVSYQYNVDLAESAVEEYQFIPKIWAKKKIEYLMAYYQTLDPNSDIAGEYRNEIADISLKYGVISEFTSFSEDAVAVEEELIPEMSAAGPAAIKLLSIANGSALLRFQVGIDLNKTIEIKIFNSRGQLVRTLHVNLHGKGVYEVSWNGLLDNGRPAPNDVYFCVIDFGQTKLTAKMVFLK